MTVIMNINGNRIEATEGQTVMEAAKKAGIEIPNLCSYDGFENGVCRLCMVESGNQPRMIPSCNTKVAENMEVATESENVRKYRKNLLSILMKNHPVHEDSSKEKCKLEDYADSYGVDMQRKVPQFEVSIDSSHPGITFDPAKCILCRRCVVACDYDQINQVISLSGRGSNVKVSFDFDDPMGESSCVSCGACVDSCPTGALIEKGWEPAERTEVTICPYCAVGCSVEYGIKDDKIIWAKGYGDSDINNGKLCVKGKFGWEYQMSADRLTTPLIRKNIGKRESLDGKPVEEVFRKASWDEALDLVAENLKKSMSKNGSNSIGGVACDRASNEDVYAFQKFMRAVAGTDNVDQSATLCHAPSASMLSYATGAGASTNSIDDVAKAKTVIMAGSNVDRAHPVLSSRIKRAVKNGTRLIIADPRRVELTRHSDIFLQLKPGTDTVLFSAMAKYILDNDLADESFIASRTEGFEDYKESLYPFTLEYAERVTGIPAETIAKVATIYSTEKPSIIFWTLGITEHENGSDNVSSLINLALITGNVGKPGTGLSPIRGQNNVQGGADMGAVAGSLPGYQPILDGPIRQKFEKKWNRELPGFQGWKSTEMINYARKGALKFLYITGENSVRSHPDTNGTIEALKKLDFLVVQDIFMTETAEYADVVLPAASSFEHSGTFTNTERRVQLVKKMFNPPGEAKPDWEIYGELAQKLGYDMNFSSSSAIMDEIASLVPSYAGIGHDRLQSGGLQWPVKDRESNGTKLLHTDTFMRGKGRFRIVSWREKDPAEYHTYPYTLITGRQREHYHTATMTSRSGVITQLEKGGSVEMNPEDMERQGLASGETVEIKSKTGSVKAKVVSSTDLPPGVMFTTFHYHDLGSNILTPEVYDPPTKTPAYKDTRVKVLKVNQ